MALFLMCIGTCLRCAVLLILGAFTVSYIDATYVYIMYMYIGGCLSWGLDTACVGRVGMP